MKRNITILLLLVFSCSFANKESSLIYQDLQKFNSLNKVLYIAAHPDDENTRALAWFSLSENAETAYLSLTRGDGGQNLIGEELSEDLGVLRTQELLAARSFDGANQYFSKAVDFGYSKSADETFDKWGKDLILADVVLMIRKFRPDVIITRFPPDERGGHGHHTASAILALEAFKLAADPSYLPEQVKTYGTWETTSIYWNASNWWNKDIGEQAKNNPNYLVKDIGTYNALIGMSFNEIGTLARSEHKCQGFGAIIERGSRIEYFEHMDGVKLKEHFFEENTQSWEKIIDKRFQIEIDLLLKNFNFQEPAKNIAQLLELKQKLDQLPNTSFKEAKLILFQQIIMDCLGLHAEILADDYAIVQNGQAKVALELINRSNIPVVLKSIDGKNVSAGILLQNEIFTQEINLENQQKISTPYWLEEPFTNVFSVLNESNALEAENKASFIKYVILSIDGIEIQAALPVIYKWRDPAFGELQREFISTPDFSVNFNEKTIILQEGQKKTVEIKIHSFKDNLQDLIYLTAPEGWQLSQKIIELNIKNKHEDYFVEIDLASSEESVRGDLLALNEAGKPFMSYTEIAYDHIPTQAIFKEAKLLCVKLDAKIKVGKVCYVKGAEDLVPQAIIQLGFDVDVINVEALSSLDLSTYQTVVLGIRIFNVQGAIRNFENKLYSYAEAGGNLVMQYNTASRNRADTKFGGPLPFEISRARVTEENAEVEFLDQKHPIMNYPNKITEKDFDNWVQERGLYFADNWDKAYTPLFSWHDVGEEDQLGALIVAKHGKGQIIYTGISFFRELPNGVEGAYRLFANLLSYESR
jgi:LmbE family N-acetylglucosaminyl deacetylase